MRLLALLLAEPLDVFHGRLAVGGEDLGEGLGLNVNGTAHELGDVVAARHLTVVVGVGGGQLEGLALAAVGIDVAYEGTGEDAIVAATAEDDPAAVAGPGVVALGIGRVEGAYSAHGVVLEVHEAEVGIVVPDVEATVLADGEHEIATVGRDAGQGGAAVDGCGIIDEAAGTEGVGVGVEALAVDVVLDVLVVLDDALQGVGDDGVVGVEVGAAVVEPLAVGRPAGEDLELVGVVLDVGYLVFLDVVGYEVALGVIDLDLVVVEGLEALTGLVGGIDDDVEGGVPCGIDASGEDGVVLHVDLADVAVDGYDGASLVLACVELHAPRVVVLVVMAVDALAVFLSGAEGVVVDDALVVVLQATLSDGEVLVGAERGGNDAVADIGVDGVGRDADGEGLVARPLVVGG